MAGEILREIGDYIANNPKLSEALIGTGVLLFGAACCGVYKTIKSYGEKHAEKAGSQQNVNMDLIE